METLRGGGEFERRPFTLNVASPRSREIDLRGSHRGPWYGWQKRLRARFNHHAVTVACSASTCLAVFGSVGVALLDAFQS